MVEGSILRTLPALHYAVGGVGTLPTLLRDAHLGTISVGGSVTMDAQREDVEVIKTDLIGQGRGQRLSGEARTMLGSVGRSICPGPDDAARRAVSGLLAGHR